METKKWAVGSNQYIKRPGIDRDRSPEMHLDAARTNDAVHELTGVSWDATAIDFDQIKQSNTARVRHRFRASLPDLIWNTAALEGNTYTLPEVRTLLDGTTIGGRNIEDEKQIIALSEGYNLIDELVSHGDFVISRDIANEVHGLVAVHEAIESGHFRGEGQVTGGGTVRLANGGIAPGREHGDGGALLLQHFDTLTDYLGRLNDPRERALAYFAAATRAQYYFDGNKRTARLMMTGELMAHGYDIVSIPYARRLELNTALDTMFETDDATELMGFLVTCTA